MKSLFKIVSIATALLFLYLFAQLFFWPKEFVEGLGMAASVATSVLCRRAAMFMLGIVLLLLCVRNLQASTVRLFICLSIGSTFFGLSSIGTYHYVTNSVNSSIFVAIILETIFWILYGIIILHDRAVLAQERTNTSH